MLAEKTFLFAILISLISHSIIIFGNPVLLNLNIFPKKENKGDMKVNYIKNPAPKPKGYKENIAPDNKEIFLKLPSKASPLRLPLPQILEKGGVPKKSREVILEERSFAKPVFAKPDVIAIKKKITLPPIPIDIDKINNPSYISYYQIVREKIRRAAYQNYTPAEMGKVDLSFIVLSDGSLKNIQLIEGRSSSIKYLREVALRSVKEASPFPYFPKELDYSQLSFNVIISFEIE